MNWQFGLGSVLLGLTMSTVTHAQNQRFTAEFPAVSTLLSETEVQKIRDFAQVASKGESCFRIGAYFSPARGSWTYRIIGRARALEIYRQLVLQGVKPQNIDIRSLGSIDEVREYKSQPSSRLVTIDIEAKGEKTCSSETYSPMASKQTAALDQLVLEYEVLDADPHPESMARFKEQVQANADSETMDIVSYSDFTGSSYLNRVLSRLRSLILFRIATLEGAVPERISLDWKGKVSPQTPDLPPPILDAQRRALVQWSQPKPPKEESVSSRDAPAAQVPLQQATVSETSPTQAALPPESHESSSPRHAWELGFRLGLATPPSSVKDDLKNTVRPEIFLRTALSPDGLGWGAEFFLSQQSHEKTKDSQVEGDIDVNRFGLALTHHSSFAESWNLLLHGGLVISAWQGEAQFRSNGERNEDSGQDTSPFVAGGVQKFFAQSLFAESRVDLSQSQASLEGWMLGVSLGLGWRF